MRRKDLKVLCEGKRRGFQGLKAVNSSKLCVPYLCSADLIPTNPAAPRPPAKTFGASDTESRYKACAYEWLSSLPGVILAVVLDVCKLVGVSMVRITLEVLTKLTKQQADTRSRYALGRKLRSLEVYTWCFLL